MTKQLSKSDGYKTLVKKIPAKIALMHYTYILISKDGRRTYTGSTSNLEKRIAEHNQGKVKTSKHFRPYELLKAEEFESLKEARARETFYKSTTGRRQLKEIVEYWKNCKIN